MRRSKKHRRTIALCILACAMVMPIGSPADTRSENAAWRYKVEVSTFRSDSSDVDGGGETDVTSYQLQAIAKRDLRSNLSVGAGFSYSYHERRFTGAGDFVSLRPWGDTSRLATSASMVVHGSKFWSLGLRPFVSTFSESGDIESDSVSYGMAAAVVARPAADRHIGFGVRLADGIDGDLDLKPVLIVDWRLSDRWRLANPSEPDALGSAGLELVHLPANDWRLALGGVYHSAKFLLDNRGFAPGGIGEHEALIMFARVEKKWPSGLNVKGYIGAAFGGTLTVENADGITIAQSDYDTMPLAGVSLETSF